MDNKQFKYLYNTIKSELAAKRDTIRGFNLEWFKQYTECVKNMDYTPLYETYFYKENGGAFCTFLEIVHKYNKYWQNEREIIAYFKHHDPVKYTMNIFDKLISDSEIYQIINANTGEILYSAIW